MTADEPGKRKTPRKARKKSVKRQAAPKAPRPAKPLPFSAETEKATKGRPTIYTTELSETICLLVAEGCSVREISELPDMPGKTTVFRWLAMIPDFRDRYALAKEASAESMADEILAIADDGSNDYMERTGKDGATAWVLNHEHIQRSKLRVDARKWLLAKLQPKKYGDRVAIDDAIPDDLPDDERASRIVAILNAARTRRDSATDSDGADVAPAAGAADAGA